LSLRAPIPSAPKLIIAFLLGSRLLLWCFSVWLPGDDGARYLAEATNLALHGVFSDSVDTVLTPTAHDMPLFPALLAAFIRMLGNPLLAARMVSLLNCFFFCIAAKGVYEAGWLLTRRYSVAAVAMLVFGCFPESFPYAVYYMPDSLFLALFVWCCVAFLRYLDSDRPVYLLAAFVLWALSALVKPISLLWGICLAVVTILMAWKTAAGLLRQLRLTIACLLAGSMLFVPWLIRNHATFGVIGLTSITGTNLFENNYLEMLDDMGVPNPSGVLAAQDAKIRATVAGAADNEMIYAAAVGSVARRAIMANLPHYAMTFVKRHPRLYLGTGGVATMRMLGDFDGAQTLEGVLARGQSKGSLPLRVWVLQIGSWLILGVLYVAALAGIGKLARARDYLTLGSILLSFAYFAIIVGPVTSTRYRMVMLPALSLAAAVGFQRRTHQSAGLTAASASSTPAAP
jgi:hypothetical protein